MTCSLASEVQDAIEGNRPIVALETSIIAQGLPYPANMDTAMAIESTIREHGAIPATIGLMDGTIRAGLDAEQIEQFAIKVDVMKVGAAELPYALGLACLGATTVSATLRCADHIGISVVATGGIGGIHRDWSATHDESHDLQAIAAAKALLVASGAKAILDIPRTLERLETLGVAVIAYGQDAFPGFWSQESGSAAPMRLDSVPEIARFHTMRTQLGATNGLLIANPVPVEHEIPRATVETWIAKALADLRANAITGKAVTPYLLRHINELSNGQSVVTNRQLVVENATLAARIAVALAH